MASRSQKPTAIATATTATTTAGNAAAIPAGTQAGGRLAENIVHFARVLRAAGLPIGPNRIIDVIKALETAGIARRDDFYWTLASVFIDRREQFELFDQAFQMFWRDPRMLERALSLLLPNSFSVPQNEAPADEDQLSTRLAQALVSELRGNDDADEASREIEPDAAQSHSSREVLQHADFESMSQTEMAQAKLLISRLRLPIPEIRTRRMRPNDRGDRVDMRATLRAAMKTGGDIIPLKRRSPRYRHPPLVVLCDVSGSMSRYSRMFLHFLHAITSDRDRVTSFVFGTRLTNVTRHLRHRDVDVAMSQVLEMIADWSGGTRIGQCLAEFNLRWSRRVLAQNATVLLISDGLDGDVGEGLSNQMERMHKSCRQLIWLNPLLRYKDFEARPAGVRAMLPHVDAFLPAHNIKSLIDLAAVMQTTPQRARPRLAA